MSGVGFSGKSTLSKKIAAHTGATLVSQDGLFFEKEKELNLNQDNGGHWRMLLDMCLERTRMLLSEGKSVVFDNINTQHQHREEVRAVALSVGAEPIVVFLDTPIEVQKGRQERSRITKERHDVKQEYLDQAIAELEIPGEDENVRIFKPDTDLNSFLANL
ncbi:MAG: ATP-binding protein [Patescibacteria group bacterium]